MKPNDPHTWLLLDRLADPSTPAVERDRILSQLQGDPALAGLLHTWRVLKQWPELERSARSSTLSPEQLARLDHELAAEILDREITRAFPWVAAAALAAAVLLAWLNLGNMRETYRNPIDALFGLPQPTLEDSFLVNL